MSMYDLRMSIAGRALGLAIALVVGFAATAITQTPGEMADSLIQLDYRFFDRPVNPDQYLIRPGEQVRVVFVGAKVPSLSLVVNADGRIANSTLGVFDLNGKTLTQAREALMPVLSSYFTTNQIEITAGEPLRTAIAITGEVARPGLYVAYTSQRVSELLELAGGITGFGSSRHITLEGGPVAIRVDLDRATYLGDSEADPPVYGGYRIHVPQRDDNVVNIVGFVRRPREIELQPSDDLSTLLALAGGVRRDGDSSRLFIVGDSLRNPHQPGSIRPRDVVMVPQRDIGDTSGVLIIFGRVTKPGRYALRGKVSFQSLLARAGGLAVDANPSRITVFRRIEEGIAHHLIAAERYPISIGRDSSTWSRFELHADDSVFVPRMVGFVRVSGEVRNPGLVPFESGKTALHYINAAGGFLAESNRQQVDVTDRISLLTSTMTPDAGVHDGDEVRVNRKEELR